MRDTQRDISQDGKQVHIRDIETDYRMENRYTVYIRRDTQRDITEW